MKFLGKVETEEREEKEESKGGKVSGSLRGVD